MTRSALPASVVLLDTLSVPQAAMSLGFYTTKVSAEPAAAAASSSSTSASPYPPAANYASFGGEHARGLVRAAFPRLDPPRTDAAAVLTALGRALEQWVSVDRESDERVSVVIPLPMVTSELVDRLPLVRAIVESVAARSSSGEAFEKAVASLLALRLFAFRSRELSEALPFLSERDLAALRLVDGRGPRLSPTMCSTLRVGWAPHVRSEGDLDAATVADMMLKSARAVSYPSPETRCSYAAFLSAAQSVAESSPGVFMHAARSPSQDITVLLRLEDGRMCILGVQCKDAKQAVGPSVAAKEDAKMVLTGVGCGLVSLGGIIVSSAAATAAAAAGTRRIVAGATRLLDAEQMAQLFGGEMAARLEQLRTASAV